VILAAAQANLFGPGLRTTGRPKTSSAALTKAVDFGAGVAAGDDAFSFSGRDGHHNPQRISDALATPRATEY
jgi:hypothetical protein